MGDNGWVPAMVFKRIVEAARTLRALRMAGLKPAGYTSSWPDVVIDPNDLQGCDHAKVPRLSPTPEAITRMDESLLWLRWLKPEQARVVWLYAEDVPRKILCARVGMSQSKAGRVRMVALEIIASMLNANRKVHQPAGNKENDFRDEYLRTGNACAAYRHVFGSEGISQVTLKQRAARLARKIR
nr:DUF6362 family protein [Candidatus Magnetaquicoccus inordinatus]